MAPICSAGDPAAFATPATSAWSSPAWSVLPSPCDGGGRGRGHSGQLPAESLKAPLLKTDLEDGSCGGSPGARWPTFHVVLITLMGVLLGAACAVAASQLMQPDPSIVQGLWIPHLRSVTPGGQTRRLQVDGRDVFVYKPAWAEGPLPVVVVLHGSYDSPLGIAEATRFEKLADVSETGFLVVLPDMRADAAGYDWAYGADVPFFREMMDRVGKEYDVDRRQVFVCGHSAGGTMALLLQNRLPDIFRAAASVEAGGGDYQEWQKSSSGSPTMLVWNHKDPVLAAAGEGFYRETVSWLRRHAPGAAPGAASGAAWAEPAAYEEPLAAGRWLPWLLGKTSVLYASRKVWPAAGTQPELQVISWASSKASHAWLNPESFSGATLDASVLIWEFFRSSVPKQRAQELN